MPSNDSQTTPSKGITISRSEEFKSSNQLLQSHIKLNKRENKENTKHKPPIPRGDLLKLQKSNVIRGGHPWGLVRNVWFHMNLYWCRREIIGDANNGRAQLSSSAADKNEGSSAR